MPSIDDLRAAVRSAPMSTALIGINLAVFIAVTIDGQVRDVLALPTDWWGLLEQPWTALTVFFTAEMLIHVGAAALVIAVFGGRFERFAGSRHVLGVYLLAGLAGSVALVITAVATGFEGSPVGASAAFLGLMGALAACPRENWGAWLPVDKVVVAVLVVQLGPAIGIGDWVSSTAHLAGLGVGAAYSYLVKTASTAERQPTSTRQ